jgi:cytochrome c oxidase cbb3-type subunit 3
MRNVKFVAPVLVLWTGALLSAAAPASPMLQRGAPPPPAGSGEALFTANCAFCHGRDATGGASGPDLTDSALVAQDVNGDKMIPVIRAGRPDKGMPPFAALSPDDLKKLVEYVHKRKTDVDANPGRRRKVSEEDISTGNADAGRAFFDGAGGCKSCHSPTGDLKGVATKFRGLALMQRLLYPTPQNGGGAGARQSRSTATVTLPSGQTLSGTLSYRDEFTIAITEPSGAYHSWPASAVKVSITDPLQAHADLLPKYTDADIHNLVAYLQTLK